MGIECEHGQLARSYNICELEALLKSSEEEMLFWRHAHRDADKRVRELEAENAAVKHDGKVVGVYPAYPGATIPVDSPDDEISIFVRDVSCVAKGGGE